MDQDFTDQIVALLEKLGWERTPNETISGLSIVVHTLLDDEGSVMGCEILHLGPLPFQHDSMHALRKTVTQIIAEDHSNSAAHN